MARTEPGMKEYLCEKFKWAEETFDDIDWESFRLAMRRLDSHRRTLTKHVNNIVPVGTRVHRYDPKYPIGCLSCGMPEEDADHLMLCPQRDQWRKNCLTALKKFFKDWDTPAGIQELLLEGVKHAWNENPIIHHSEDLLYIKEAQEAIGWKEVFRGRLSIEWQRYQSEYLGSRADKKVNGQTWATALATLFLDQWYKCWLARNSDRHGHDKQTQADAAKRQAIREVVQIYDLYKGQVEPHLNWILAMPLDDRIQKKTYVLRAWINSYEPILKKSHEYQTRLETG